MDGCSRETIEVRLPLRMIGELPVTMFKPPAGSMIVGWGGMRLEADCVIYSFEVEYRPTLP